MDLKDEEERVRESEREREMGQTIDKQTETER